MAEEGVEAVRSGADARVADAGERAGFEVLVEGVRDAWSGSAVHGEACESKNEIERERDDCSDRICVCVCGCYMGRDSE